MRVYLRHHGALTAGLLLALAIALGTALGAGEQLRRAAVVSGGGVISAGSLRLQGSVGQPAVGAVRNEVVLCSGLQCGPGAPELGLPARTLYLPLLAR